MVQSTQDEVGEVVGWAGLNQPHHACGRAFCAPVVERKIASQIAGRIVAVCSSTGAMATQAPCRS
jgi:hypothetical protein